MYMLFYCLPRTVNQNQCSLGPPSPAVRPCDVPHSVTAILPRCLPSSTHPGTPDGDDGAGPAVAPSPAALEALEDLRTSRHGGSALCTPGLTGGTSGSG